MKRSKGRGFTLVELMVVLGLVSVMVAMVAPALNGMGAQSKLRTAAHTVAARLAAARFEAIASGRTVLVSRATDGLGLQVAAVPDLSGDSWGPSDTSATASGPDVSGVTEIQLDGMDLRIPSADNVQLQTPTGSDEVLAFRPTGYVRGDNYASNASTTEVNLSDDNWELPLRSTHPSAKNIQVTVVVTPLGLICVQEAGQTCP
ncbi:MAG: GspH/FimT family pseudopilin [Myxococcota bacterium]